MAPSADARNSGHPSLSPRARLAWRRAADELLIASIFGGHELPGDDEADERAPHTPAAPPRERRRTGPPAF